MYTQLYDIFFYLWLHFIDLFIYRHSSLYFKACSHVGIHNSSQ